MKYINLRKVVMLVLMAALMALTLFPVALAGARPAKTGSNKAVALKRKHPPARHKRPHKPPGYNDLDGTKVVDGVIRDGAFSADIDGKAGNNITANGEYHLGRRGTQDLWSLGLWELNIKLKNQASGRIRVSRVPAPDNAPPRAIGFFKVKLTGFSDQDIADATITFWVGNRFVDVRLGHFSSGKWTLLKTVKVESGARRSKYSAVSPGFSTFAIIAEPAGVDAKPAGGGWSLTSRASLYIVGLLGIVFIVTGATIRVRARG